MKAAIRTLLAVILPCLISLVVEAPGLAPIRPLMTVIENNCFTTTSSAMAPIYDLDKPISEVDLVHYHISAPKRFCDPNESCRYDGDYWQTKRSLLEPAGPIDNLITDRRWEDMPTHVTSVTERGKYVNVAEINANSSAREFVVPFSVHAQVDAHLLLCNGAIQSSACYWFILLQAGGTFRMCPAKQMQYDVESECYQSTRPIKDKDQRNLLKAHQWNHFKITKTGSTLRLLDVQGQVVMTTDIRALDIELRHVYFHSEMGNALWKVHDFKYFYSPDSGSSRLQLMNIGQGGRCLSMFVAMCSRCLMDVKFVTYNFFNRETNLGGQSLSSHGETWYELAQCVNVNQNDMYVIIEKYTEDRRETRRTTQFWAFSDVRSVLQDDFRILTPNPAKWTGKCQYLVTDTVLDIKTIDTLNNWQQCQENEFGEACTPCRYIFQTDACPRGGAYCQLLVMDDASSIRKKCFCPIGYQGAKCQDVCRNRTYGHGCQRSCAQCENGCANDTVSGDCNLPGHCFDNYLGKKCDKPPGLFLFDDLPEIAVDLTLRNCTLRLKSFKGTGVEANMRYYKFQYKQKEAKDWIDATPQPFRFKQPSQITLYNLKPESTYEVRAFGYGKTDDLDQLSHVTPKIATFSTYCRELNSSQINITTGSSWVKVSFELVSSSCPLSSYWIAVDGKPLTEGKGAKNVYTKEGLEPYTRYELRITKKGKNTPRLVSEQFRTDESPPGQVSDFRFHQQKQNNKQLITLSWEKPRKPNGLLLWYTVTTQLKALWACKAPSKFETTAVDTYYVSVDTTSLSLVNLKAYAQYMVEVKANTSAGFGQSSSLFVTTDPINELSDDETPKLRSVTAGITSATFHFDRANCERLRGPLKVRIEVWGTDSWCNSVQSHEEDGPSPTIRMPNLSPFCHYNATLRYVRGDTVQYELPTEFRTKEDVPNDVRDLLVTSKGPNHISLRWLPPWPPTGVLEKYKIGTQYFFRRKGLWSGDLSKLKEEEVLPSSCEFWPEFHCASIHHGLEEDYVYLVTVTSKNKGNDNYSRGISKKVKATEKEPGKPYGLNAKWTDDNHLNLEWFHPSESNGRLISFQINVTDDQTHNITLNKTIGEYKLIYTVTIKENLTFPNDYAVSVRVGNSRGCSPEDSIAGLKSPPPIPESYVDGIRRTENSITVKFSRPKFRKSFDRFLYALISECETCQASLEAFRKLLLEHHSFSNELQTGAPVQYWRRLKSYRHTNSFDGGNDDLVVNNTNLIKKASTYYLAFVWVHKHAGYVRISCTVNSTSLGDAVSKKQPHNVAKIAIATVLLMVTVALVVLLLVRFKGKILKTVRGTFGTVVDACQATVHPPTDTEPTYMNQVALDLSQGKVIKRQSLIRTIRPLSMLPCEEICPGVPSFKTKHSRPVKLDVFEEYVKSSIESDELRRQHATFPRGQTKEWTYGVRPENKAKNRYQNLIAYDHTRVVLNKINNDDFSDYINANFIDGYRRPRAYIATQGPKKNTVNDFWRMIWQEKVAFIVMVANVIEGNKKKTEKYWPDVNEQATFGDYKVTFVSSEVHANYEYRTFELQYQYVKPRQVSQLHFKVWPDHGVPLYPQDLVPFLKRMLLAKQFPLLIHCSAGVGRTGTIILCDLCLRMAAYEGHVDAFAMLEHLRNHRPNMVDNIEQYKLAHLVILNCIFTGLNTSIPISQDFEAVVKATMDLDREMNHIKNCEWQDDAMKTVAFTDGEKPPPIVASKNRFPHIIPDDVARVFLHPYPPQCPDTGATYINAVRVNGFCQPGRFIVTQFPLADTTGDFWRMVVEQEIAFVVCLNEIPYSTCKPFWPKKHSRFRPVDVVHVTHLKSTDCATFSVMTFELATFYEYAQQNEPRMVQLAKFHGWNYPDQVPPLSSFITFVEQTLAMARNSKKVIVACYDGATASGLFIALSFLMEKIKLEHECDVCQAVRSIRINRKQFVNTKMQLEFLYKASVLYVEEKFFQYSNIQ